MQKWKRRSFTKAYELEVVALVRKSGKSTGVIAKEFDPTEAAVRAWMRQAEADSGRESAGTLTTAEREELAHLRRCVETLEMEPEIPRNVGCSA